MEIQLLFHILNQESTPSQLVELEDLFMFLIFHLELNQSALVVSSNLSLTYDEWHSRLGHINKKAIRALVGNDLVRGIKNVTGTVAGRISCASCEIGKH